MKPVKVGIIGCGNISGIYAQNCMAFKNLELVACADLEPARAEKLAKEYFPLVVRVGTVVAVVYFLLAKPLQILILALLPFFGARFYSVPLTYGEAFKIATFSMIPPVVLDLIVDYTAMRLATAFGIYFGLYVLLLVLATRDLAATDRTGADPASAITP